MENEITKVEYGENTAKILEGLLVHLEAKSPRAVANVDDDAQLNGNDLVVITVEHVLNVANKYKWDLARHQDAYYLFTGTHWKRITNDELCFFLGKSAEKIKIDKLQARHFRFKDNLLKQFYASAYFDPPISESAETKINLDNGTYVISKDGHYLKPFDKSDFLLYKLPFAFDQEAKAPIFQKYLDRVLPDEAKQKVLAEYLGYVFIKNSVLKLEKAMILYGTGSNGKSVLFDIVLNLLGKDNVCSYSLQNLTDDKSYTRSLLSGKLLNYASELSSKLNPTTFKMLVSGEPIEARMIYGKPFLLTDYARLLFNTNVLPKDVEHNNAYYRRLLILGFEETISDEEKNPGLANTIIKNELPGVFNWVLDGLNRLLSQGDFTQCLAITNAIEDFKRNSDSVSLYLEDGNYVQSPDDSIALKTLYERYTCYCKDSGYTSCSLKVFSERLRNYGYEVNRKSSGRFVGITKSVSD